MTPSPRNLALAIAAGRIALGISILATTRPALGALGSPRTDAAGETLAKLAGGRDIALGLLTIAARDDSAALARATIVSAGVDAADVFIFTAAGRKPGLRRVGVTGALSGGAAAVAAAWAWRRLG